MFTTFRPNEDICGFGGDGAVCGVNYATGTATPGVTGVGAFNASAPAAGTELERSLDLGEGQPSSLSLRPGKGDSGKLFVQTSTGEIKEIDADLPDPSGSVVWYEQ